jgi:ketol-acid reductoisomerase
MTTPSMTESSASADLDALRTRRIAVIGYGNQGQAHALNLRDSGCTVRIGARPGGRGRTAAEADGFTVQPIDDAAGWADLIAILLPDQVHRSVYERSVAPHLQPGNVLLVAHGFSLQYGQIVPPSTVDVILVAPVGPGSMLRRLFLAGSGIPALVGVGQDASGQAACLAHAYADALGCTRVGVQSTTVAEETETDLFGEQAVLCGGIPALMLAGYDTLVEAGYQPELAYYECIHQVKLIVDLIYERGIAGMRAAISDTARYGAYLAAPRVVDRHVRDQMAAVLDDIRTGTFARRWIAEGDSGSPALQQAQAEEGRLPVELLGARLRARMALGTDDPGEPPDSAPA